MCVVAQNFPAELSTIPALLLEVMEWLACYFDIFVLFDLFDRVLGGMKLVPHIAIGTMDTFAPLIWAPDCQEEVMGY